MKPGLVAAVLVLGGLACSRQRAAPASPAPGSSAPAPLLLERACVPGAPERCLDATDDDCDGIIDEGCGLQTGAVQFVIAWDAPAADVDLRVTDPNGELAEAGRKLASGLVKERDCPGRNNDCRGHNLENVFLDALEPVRGIYKVRVVLEELGGESPPVRVIFGARVGPRSHGFELRLEEPDAAYEGRFEL